jgi:beta-lactamase class A
MREFIKEKWLVILLILVAFISGVLMMSISKKKVVSESNKQDCSSEYPFISDEIDCEKIDDIAGQVNELHGNISGIINEEKNNKNLIRASVFYRDLKSRRWFGINDLEKYYPASLLKLPMALVYYKIAELQPDIFSQSLVIPAEGQITDNSDQHYPPENPLVPGNTYKIGEMIDHMLFYSDNAPFSILKESSGLFYNRVFVDLGVYASLESNEENNWNYSPRIFANIFRMLYNSSYVNVNYSNEVLEKLSQSSFKKGIVAGVPAGVKVSHKFGEATAMENETKIHSRVLNDCGIVYKPDKPYILCVMAEGDDFSKIEKVIERIAQASYESL